MAVENPVTQRMVDWLLYTLLLLCAAVTLMPFLYLVCSAVKTKATFFSSPFLPPGHGFLGVDWSGLTLEHFYILFTPSPVS
jgi:ABC-type glycerol-3-phosphate transport system permease component